MNLEAANPLPDWFLDGARYRFGLLKKRPEGLPKPPPKWAVDQYDMFEAWSLWHDRHRPRPRPRSFWPIRKVPTWAYRIRSEIMAKRREQKKKPKPPTPLPPPLPPASWTHPGPVILGGVYEDPSALYHHPGTGATGRIIVPGVAPVWEVRQGNKPDGALVGYIAQIEGDGQYQHALDYLASVPGHQRAVIGTLGVDPKRMLDIGVTSYFVELNAQAGWDPYGDREKLVWQAHHDGWPHVIPSYGVYSPVSLEDYANYKGQGVAVPFAVFSAEGLGDTDSWDYLATLGA